MAREGTNARSRAAPWLDPAAVPLLRFEGVSKRFGDAEAVKTLDLAIYAGEFFALLGPSGCGKTTLMRLLAGFETPDAGRIIVGGEDIAALRPYQRPVNLMFQSYALFPHLSVEDNIAYGLRREGMGRALIADRVAGMLALVKLDGLQRRKPHQLSGGQCQRVALARALAKRPKILLLDEPMAALDRRLREETRFELMALQAELGTTFVIVTHDQDEAMSMSTRMAVMEAGRIIQTGPPETLYEAPATRSVARFLGDANLLEGTIAARHDGEAEIETACGNIRVTAGAGERGDRVAIMIRPEKLSLAHPGEPAAANTIAGEVVDIAYRGDSTLVMIAPPGGTVLKAALTNSQRARSRAFSRGAPVVASFASDGAMLLTD